jgi:hypothetical protein
MASFAHRMFTDLDGLTGTISGIPDGNRRIGVNHESAGVSERDRFCEYLRRRREIDRLEGCAVERDLQERVALDDVDGSVCGDRVGAPVSSSLVAVPEATSMTSSPKDFLSRYLPFGDTARPGEGPVSETARTSAGPPSSGATVSVPSRYPTTDDSAMA